MIFLKIILIGVVFDVRSKKHVRTIRRWSGQVTKDGRLGLVKINLLQVLFTLA